MVTFISFVIIDQIFEQTFYDASIDVIKQLIELPSWVKYYFGFYEGPVYRFTLIYIFLSISLLNNKGRALKSITIYTFGEGFRNVMMSAFREERPNWLMDDSRIKCGCGFGKPSGHVSGTTLSFGLFYHDFVYKSKNLSKVTKILLLALYFFFCWNACVGRMYLGAHTFPQVVYGHLYALSLVTFAAAFDKSLTRFYNKCVEPFGKMRIRNLLMFVATMAVFFSFIGMWFIADLAYSSREESNENPFIKGRCQKCFSGILQYANHNMLGICHAIIAPGLHLGLCLGRSNYKIHSRHWRQPVWKAFLRILIIALPFIFYSATKFLVNTSLLVDMLMQGSLTFLGGFLTMIMLVWVVPSIGLSFKGDIYSKHNPEIIDGKYAVENKGEEIPRRGSTNSLEDDVEKAVINRGIGHKKNVD